MTDNSQAKTMNKDKHLGLRIDSETHEKLIRLPIRHRTQQI